MKKSLMLILLILSAFESFSQNTVITDDAAKDLKKDGYKVNTDVLKFGMSLGFNYLTKNVYDAVLSPIDKTLQLQSISPITFLLSTSIIINPISSYYRKLDATGKPIGDLYAVPTRLSFVATVNLAQFGASQTNAFNSKIDGGLGLGVRLSDDFHMALTAETISVRQLRDYIIDSYSGKQIIVNNEALNSLDINDNSLFVDKYYFGVSIKFIYILVGNN